MRITIFRSIVSIAFALVLFSGVAEAQGTNCATGAGGFVPLACFERSDKLRALYTEGDLGTFLNKLFMGAIALGGILAVLRLAWAGFVYMSTDLWGQKGHAKEIIQETLLGLFLLLAIWVILNLINPDLLKLKVETKQTSNPSTVQTGGGTTPTFP